MKSNLVSLRRLGARTVALATGAVVAQAHAQAVDLTALTTAVDFSTVAVAILAVAGALVTVYITIKAAIFVIGMVRRG